MLQGAINQTEPISATHLNAYYRAYVEAADEFARQDCEGELFLAVQEFERVHRFLRRIIYRRGLSDHYDEIAQTIEVSFLLRLRSAAQTPDAPVIQDVKNYLAEMAYRACNDHLRAQYPEWSKLKNRLSRVCTRESNLMLWNTPTGQRWAGLTQQQQQPALDAARLHALEASFRQRHLAPLSETELTRQLLAAANAPVELNALVDMVARLLGITDAVISLDAPPDEDEAGGASWSERLPAPPPVEVDERLPQFWNGVKQMALLQRRVFLLAWEGTDQLPLAGIASMQEIAAALEWESLEAFYPIWKEIPLPDKVIAELLATNANAVAQNRIRARASLRRILGWDMFS